MAATPHTPPELTPSRCAGLYEDPSAVLRGWQENPVDFDSLFNRSTVTYAWGSPDILSVFTKDPRQPAHIHTHSYDPGAEDFSGGSSTVLLDQWVFDRFAAFVRTEHDQLRPLDGAVFFLHLLGLDTAGHVHKPNSPLFDANLAAVDAGIAATVRLVDELFGDGRTAFVFTADHGMTDAGAHGAGQPHETETPFVAWGAGFAHWRRLVDGAGAAVADAAAAQRTHRVGPTTDVPRFDIDQADAAPLMAAVLGLAVPMNNFGTLPARYLNASQSYMAAAMRANALQMGAQFEQLRAQHGRGVLAGWLGDYASLNGDMVLAIERRIDTALANGRWELAVSEEGRWFVIVC